MARDLSNLSEFNLKDAKNVNILVGCIYKGAMNFANEKGQEVNIEPHYILHRVTNCVREKSTYGYINKEVKVSVEDFKDIFGNEVNFLNEWIFRPVVLGLDTDDRDKKLILYTCEVSHRYDIKK